MIVGVSVGVVMVLSAGSAFAAYRYDVATSDRILPGVTIGGVEVGDMERDEAVRTLREKAEETLYSELVVEAAGRSWTVTPASLGMTADVEGAVDQAFALADHMSLTSRVYHRLRNISVDASLDLPFVEDRGGVKAFVQQAFDEVSVPAVNAQFALVEGELVTRRSHSGQELAMHAATDRILRALSDRADTVSVPVKTLDPKVTTASLGPSVVVDLSENHLYLYDGLHVVKEYPVATAAPGYSTPVGNWEIVNKQENPTWYNPAIETWGADLPPMIAPGPGNPLGTRALYLNAPGIRIHGTYSSSSIGTYASHGCIRMYISDSEDLYGRVPVGTRAIIKP